MTTPSENRGPFSNLFGEGGAAEQLVIWGVVQQVLSVLLRPGMDELGQLINHAFPNVLLSPADVATAINRSFMTQGAGVTEANGSGIDEARLNILRSLAGNAPSPTDLVTALRRGIIQATGTGADATSFQQGIAEGNLLDKWTDVMRQLAVEWPTPADALAAVLEGQIDQATGEALYAKFGGDPQYFQLLFNTRGNAPTPVEALDLANRGIIPWSGTGPDATSYEQAFLEGPWRNKWLDPYKALGQYRPPPETVRAMLEANGITQEQATAYWTSYGMTADTIAQYILTANNTKNQLTQGLTESAILQMYYNQLISQQDATQFLALMGIDAANATLLIAYTDMQRSIAAVTTAVSRIQTLYTSRKITQQTARDALTRLQVPGEAIDGLITTWNVVASANVKTLTEAQIVDAWSEQVLTQDQAESELEALGYTPFDAWVLLSTKNKAPLPNQPAETIGAPLGAVIPGVT
jgi:hypothetical protein